MRTLSLKQQVINEYYASGQIMNICEYVNNKKNGWDIWFHENGNKWIEAEYKDDIQHGLERYYSKDGLIIYERPYKNDAIHGTERWFDEFGNVIKEYEYKDSFRQLSKG